MRARIIVIAVFLILGSLTAEAALRVVVDSRPFAILHSANLDGFEARRRTGSFSSSSAETVSNNRSIVPTIRAGLGFDGGDTQSDLTFGIGPLWNRAFDTTAYSVEGTARVPLLGAWLLGIHLGLVHFSAPSWHGEADLGISPATGLVSGLTLQQKGPASLTLSLHYLRAKFAVDGNDEWTPNRSSIDISGPVASFGFLLQF